MSYRTSGEFRESKKMGNIGPGGGIGGREGGNKVNPDPQPSAEDVYGVSPNLGIAQKVQDDRFSPDTNKGFVDTVKKGIESVLAPQNIMPAVINALVPGAGILAMVPNILGAFGFNVNTQPSVAPEDPRGGRADERMLAQIPQQTMPVQLFGGDTIKLQRYEDFMKAGYPPDMAEYLVNQLV